MTNRQKRQRLTVRWKPPDIPHASATDKTYSLSEEFQKNVDEN